MEKVGEAAEKGPSNNMHSLPRLKSLPRKRKTREDGSKVIQKMSIVSQQVKTANVTRFSFHVLSQDRQGL